MVPDGEGTVTLSGWQRRQVLGVATDITQRKQLEDQFRQAHKMEAVGQLAGGITEAITRTGDRPLDEQVIEKPFTVHTMLAKVGLALVTKDG